MRLNRFAETLACAYLVLSAGVVQGQIVTATPVVPDAKVTSPGRVDMRSGAFLSDAVDLTIGNSEMGGISLHRFPGNFGKGITTNWHFGVSKKPNPSGGHYYQVQNRSVAKTFYSFNGTSFQDVSLDGGDGIAKLQLLGSGSSRYFEYTTGDSTVVRFLPSTDGTGTGAYELKRPDGLTYTFAYDSGGPGGTSRLRRVSSNLGYVLIFEYNVSPSNGTKACVFNSAITTPPTSHECPAGARSVVYTYAGDRLGSITYPDGGVWTITNNYSTSSAPFQEYYYKPGYGQAWLTNYYTTNTSPHYVGQQLFGDGRTLTYNFDWLGKGEIGTGSVFIGNFWVENGASTTSIGWKTYQLDSTKVPAVAGPGQVTDPLSRSVKRTYDGAFTKVLTVTMPNGLKSTYTYNANRSITQVQQTVPAGFTEGPLSVNYTYDCTVAINCKKPVTMTDPRSNTTNYAYDPVHGGMLSETRPAPLPGEVRPQRRYSWAQYYAWYRSSAGTLVQSTTPVWLVSSISECRTLSSCLGTEDEVRTEYTYGTAGTANNLSVTKIRVAAGDGSLSSETNYAYDADGNRVEQDGPLAGSVDRSVWKFDSMRRVVGEISADPDASGPLLYRATRTTYDLAGRATKAERGTTNGQADSDFNAFIPLESEETEYDLLDRKVKTSLKDGGTVHSVTQYSYDIFGRHECTAVRMNAEAFGSLPSSACLLGTQGAQGPDRITQNFYDAAGQLTSTQVGVGTTAVATDSVNTYTANGKLQTATDGESNKTTFEYDGHDRLKKTRFPETTAGTQQSSATLFEQFEYDANSNVIGKRLRDEQWIYTTFDTLNRARQKTLPSPESAVAFTYDLQGRMLSATQGTTSIAMSWDALGRNRTETTALGQMRFDYDVAGRRTKTTWPDGFYTTQSYYYTGEPWQTFEYDAATIATHGYDNKGNYTSIARANGTLTTFGYGPLSRLQSLSHDLGGTNYDSSTTFTYNVASQIQSITRDNDAYAWTEHYNQDKIDSINGLNQIGVSGSVAFTHDPKGNLTNIGGSLYGYSAENRMSAAPGGATLVYDPLGRLSEVSKNGVVTKFQYDGVNLVAEYGPTNALLRRYVHPTTDDEPILWYEPNDTSYRRYLVYDEHGSVVAVSNGDAQTIGVNTYDEYGVPNASRMGRFGYTGQTWIAEAGLYYFKARMYSPSLGRFMQADPLGYADGLNLYAYARNDPITNSDPAGTLCKAKDKVSVPKSAQSTNSSNDPSSDECAKKDPVIVCQSIGYMYCMPMEKDLADVVARQQGAMAELASTFIPVGGTAMAIARITHRLAGPVKWWLTTNKSLNRLMGSEQRQLLRDFVGRGMKGALNRAKSLSIPEGLTRESLLIAREIARRAIAEGIDKGGIQAARLALIEQALSQMP